MGWISNLFKKEEPKQTTHAEVLSGHAPIFSQFGQNIYASDVVQQAISCIVNEMKKLQPQHIRLNGNDVVPVEKSSIQKVLDNPNPLMTTSEFIEKVTWLLFLNYNAFIIPSYYEWKDEKGVVHRRYEALYPVLPSQVDFIEDASGRLFVKFKFNNGQEYTVKYSDVIHLKYRYSVNQYMGGNEVGQPDNDALLKTLNLNHQLLEGIAKGMKASYAVNAVVKYNTMLDTDKTEKAIKDLESKLNKSESGFLPMDLRGEYIPINKNLALVDEGVLKFIDEKILRNYGVSLPILTGDYTQEQYQAFYQKTIEPFVISYSQGFSKTLLTDREKGFKNQIKFYTKDLTFMTTNQVLEMSRILGDRGSLYENELRGFFGMRPLPELSGKRMMSLNYVDVEIANKYQLQDKTDSDNDNTGENGGADDGEQDADSNKSL
jgi:HK97 family phage portal protein